MISPRKLYLTALCAKACVAQSNLYLHPRPLFLVTRKIALLGSGILMGLDV